jgi:hypothetical protein
VRQFSPQLTRGVDDAHQMDYGGVFMAITCREAIQEAFDSEGGILETAKVIDRIYKRYPVRPWKPNAISAHLIGLSVNHSSSIHHPSLRRHSFLFSLGNGRYRRWEPTQDGQWGVVDGRIQLLDTSSEPELASDEAGAEVSAIDSALSLERDMERCLLRDLTQLAPGIRLFEGDGVSGNQLDTGVVGRLDVLAVDKKGDFIVIELKAGRAEDRVCGQILRYMGWVKEHLAQDHEVRGIVVANDFSESLRCAARAMPMVALKRYSVRFEFADI